jgi:DNA gyrase subunit B
MPELIERGNLYIAQPPLYKVSRARSERYLKDQREYEAYLVAEGTKDASVVWGSGEKVSGQDLIAAIEWCRGLRQSIEMLAMKYPRAAVEQAAIAGALNPESLHDPARAAAMAAEIARRLDVQADEFEKGWTGSVEKNAIVVAREVRGVREDVVFDMSLLGSADARKLDRSSKELFNMFGAPATLTRGETATQVHSISELLDAVFAAGQKGVTIQRYKGLGEMNPEQLWETTLDSNVRSLLQVKVDHADTADDIFSKLMGDVVEPRREFIQDNALNVANLDV